MPTGDGESVGDGDGVRDCVGVGEGVAVAVATSDTDHGALAEGTRDGDGTTLSVPLSVTESVAQPDGDAPCTNEAVAADADGSDAEAEGDHAVDIDATQDALPSGDADARVEAVKHREGVAREVTLTEAEEDAEATSEALHVAPLTDGPGDDDTHATALPDSVGDAAVEGEERRDADSLRDRAARCDAELLLVVLAEAITVPDALHAGVCDGDAAPLKEGDDESAAEFEALAGGDALVVTEAETDSEGLPQLLGDVAADTDAPLVGVRVPSVAVAGPEAVAAPDRVAEADGVDDSESFEPDAAAERVACAERDAETDPDADAVEQPLAAEVAVAHAVVDAVSVALGVHDGCVDADGVALPRALTDGHADALEQGVAVRDVRGERDGEAHDEIDGLRHEYGLCVALDAGDRVVAPEGVVVPLVDPLMHAVSVRVAHGVERGLLEGVAVAHSDAVPDVVPTADAVVVGVTEPVGRAVELAQGDDVAQCDVVADTLLEARADGDSDDDCDGDGLTLALCDAAALREGVAEARLDRLDDGELEDERDTEELAVARALREGDRVTEGLATDDADLRSVAVAHADAAEPLAETEDDGEVVPSAAVALADSAVLGDCREEAVTLGDAVPEITDEALRNSVGKAETEGLCVGDTVGRAERDAERLSDGVADGVPDRRADALDDAISVGDVVLDALKELLGDGVDEREADGDALLLRTAD